MKSSVKIALFVVFFLGLAGILFGIYMFNLKPANLQKANPDFRITATELQAAYEKSEAEANSLYLNKIIEVTGIIESIKPGENKAVSISLKTGNPVSDVICTLPEGTGISPLREGDNVTIRGECSGSLMDILLNNCVIIDTK